MFSVRRLLAASALAVALTGWGTASPALAGVVVKSSGPSAAQFPVGKKIDDSETINLREGDSVTVLTNGGTRVIRGPGTHRVGARGQSRNTAFAMLTRQSSGSRVRTGAVRRGTSIATARNPNLWNLDVTSEGKMCLPSGRALQLWRPDPKGAGTYILRSAVSDFHLHVTFGDGDTTASIGGDDLPLSENKIYNISGPSGGAAKRVEFVVLDSPPDSPEGLAEVLVANGCSGQLDLMAESLAAN